MRHIKEAVPRHKRPERAAYMKEYLRAYYAANRIDLGIKRREYVKTLSHETTSRYTRTYNKKYPARYLLRIARTRAKKYGLDFNLDESDCAVPELCPILGLPLVVSSGIRGYPSAASLDRIDNTKGYVKGNVQVISLLANQMKSTANAEQLLAFARWIQATYGKA